MIYMCVTYCELGPSLVDLVATNDNTDSAAVGPGGVGAEAFAPLWAVVVFAPALEARRTGRATWWNLAQIFANESASVRPSFAKTCDPLAPNRLRVTEVWFWCELLPSAVHVTLVSGVASWSVWIANCRK